MKSIYIFFISLMVAGCTTGNYKVYENVGKDSINITRVGLYLNHGNNMCVNYTGATIFNNYEKSYQIPFSIDDVIVRSMIDYFNENDVEVVTFNYDEYPLSGQEFIAESSWDASTSIVKEKKARFLEHAKNNNLDLIIISSSLHNDYINREEKERCDIYHRNNQYGLYTGWPQFSLFNAKTAEYLGFRRLSSVTITTPVKGDKINASKASELKSWLYNKTREEMILSKLIQ